MKKSLLQFLLQGRKDWVKLETIFHIDKPQNIKIRIGFVDGNGFGKASFDDVTLDTIERLEVLHRMKEKRLSMHSVLNQMLQRLILKQKDLEMQISLGQHQKFHSHIRLCHLSINGFLSV